MHHATIRYSIMVKKKKRVWEDLPGEPNASRHSTLSRSCAAGAPAQHEDGQRLVDADQSNREALAPRSSPARDDESAVDAQEDGRADASARSPELVVVATH
ncbi:MAG: hypothetical protein Q7T73_16720 [Beijerinckiaceae bacterium]|nr:hypothetical protein [Beijerinckiaceae bacterium]